MYLKKHEQDIFFNLFFDLLCCVNKKHKIVSRFGGGRHAQKADPEKLCQIRDELFDNPAWIDEYIREHQAELSEDEREILVSWRRHFIKGDFIVMRNLKKYSVLMSVDDEDPRLYGVIGLNHPFADFFDQSGLPAIIDALILPFRGQIIYDGFFYTYDVSIGSGLRKKFAALYAEAKARFGIIESLPFDDSKPRPVETAPARTTAKTPAEAQKKYDEIAPLITAFCAEKLGAEFTAPCLYALTKLRRKRPSPLLKGNANTWACGIVYAIASNNFVFDRSQPYFMTAQDIAAGFGLSKSTAQNKSAEINKLLRITYFLPEYTIDSLRERSDSLLNNMLSFLFR
jgi:hypothetical protein